MYLYTNYVTYIRYDTDTDTARFQEIKIRIGEIRYCDTAGGSGAAAAAGRRGATLGKNKLRRQKAFTEKRPF